MESLRQLLLILFLVPGLMTLPVRAAAEDAFPLLETTIADIHAAVAKGELTFQALVQAYQARIERYDESTGVNALLLINPEALSRAAELDAEYARTGTFRPLHGIPVIVKDNYDTADMETTAGSIALKGSLPPDDAFQVRRLREAGAIVLAKSNMAEWAFSPVVTVSSVGGTTRNPYDLERVPAGSSGGTAAAVAANFGVVGLGTDTGNSIRGPSSHTALVGIRSTIGATSRDGIVPLNLRQDVGGPMARTVADAVRVFEAIAGYDPADPITERSRDQLPASYSEFLDQDGLKGARIGVFRRYMTEDNTDPRIIALMEQAIADMEAAGATIVDPFDLSFYSLRLLPLGCDRFVFDVNNYLATRSDSLAHDTIQAIYEAGLYDPSVEDRMVSKLKADSAPDDRVFPCNDVYSNRFTTSFRKALLAAMDKADVDAIVYPTWSYPPRLIGDLDSPSGNNSGVLAPKTGFPAVSVPIGYVDDTLPTGMTFVGRLFAEPDLIRFAYGYEQATLHRRPPPGFE
ncbi:MAG: amidase family protein [Pseudomonadota bacterium]